MSELNSSKGRVKNAGCNLTPRPLIPGLAKMVGEGVLQLFAETAPYDCYDFQGPKSPDALSSYLLYVMGERVEVMRLDPEDDHETVPNVSTQPDALAWIAGRVGERAKEKA